MSPILSSYLSAAIYTELIISSTGKQPDQQRCGIELDSVAGHDGQQPVKYNVHILSIPARQSTEMRATTVCQSEPAAAYSKLR